MFYGFIKLTFFLVRWNPYIFNYTLINRDVNLHARSKYLIYLKNNIKNQCILFQKKSKILSIILDKINFTALFGQIKEVAEVF